MTSPAPFRGATTSSYNLLHQPAIELTGLDGRPAHVSLSSAILDADQYQGIISQVPTAMPSLLRRALLPITLGALGQPDPDIWEQRFRRGAFSDDERQTIENYLRAREDRFHLLGDTGRPFAQAPKLEASNGEIKPVSLLLPHIATGNNVPFFTPFTDRAGPELSPVEAFEALVHCLDWDTAALKSGAAGDPNVTGGTTKGNPTGPLGQLGVVIPLGTTLFHTLLLNTPARYGGAAPGDRPQWDGGEPPGPTWEERPPVGLMDLFTWPSRRIRLVAEVRPGGPVVTGVVCTAGDRISVLPEWEPHTLWRRAEDKKLKGRFVPMRHRSGKAAWRSFDALLALTREDGSSMQTSVLLDQAGTFVRDDRIPVDYPLRVAVYGIEYGTQSAVVANAIVDEVPLPVAALTSYDNAARSSVLEAVRQADRIRLALDRYQNDLRLAGGGDKLEWDKGSHAGAELIAALDTSVRRLLSGFQSSGSYEDLIEAGMRAWEQIVWDRCEAIAVQLRESAPPEAFFAVASKSDTKTAAPVARADRVLLDALRTTLLREAERRTPPRKGDEEQ